MTSKVTYQNLYSREELRKRLWDIARKSWETPEAPPAERQPRTLTQPGLPISSNPLMAQVHLAAQHRPRMSLAILERGNDGLSHLLDSPAAKQPPKKAKLMPHSTKKGVRQAKPMKYAAMSYSSANLYPRTRLG
ncbi:MAG TPA: hypothetical protein VFP68_06855 [Burkholderiaceae bacterium]|nr:hypothetical protein [Burkholderiaceae bacterium]